MSSIAARTADPTQSWDAYIQLLAVDGWRTRQELRLAIVTWIEKSTIANADNADLAG